MSASRNKKQWTVELGYMSGIVIKTEVNNLWGYFYYSYSKLLKLLKRLLSFQTLHNFFILKMSASIEEDNSNLNFIKSQLLLPSAKFVQNIYQRPWKVHTVLRCNSK